MAAAQKERSAKTAAKRKTRGEEELRLHTLAGTRQALAELMAWHGIEEQGEAITLMLPHLHALRPAGPSPFFAQPRHEFSISVNNLKSLIKTVCWLLIKPLGRTHFSQFKKLSKT